MGKPVSPVEPYPKESSYPRQKNVSVMMPTMPHLDLLIALPALRPVTIALAHLQPVFHADRASSET
jgi:hypothetical protein